MAKELKPEDIAEVIRYFLRQDGHALDKIHRSLNPACKWCDEFDKLAEKWELTAWVKKTLNIRETG